MEEEFRRVRESIRALERSCKRELGDATRRVNELEGNTYQHGRRVEGAYDKGMRAGRSESYQNVYDSLDTFFRGEGEVYVMEAHNPEEWNGDFNLRPLSSGEVESIYTKVSDLPKIQSRAVRSLEHEGVTRLGQVALRTEEQLLNVDNFGVKSLEFFRQALAERGLRFGMDLLGYVPSTE